jgi:hypothetical protein
MIIVRTESEATTVENEDSDVDENSADYRHDHTAAGQRGIMQYGRRRPKADRNPRQPGEKQALTDASLRFRTGPADYGEMR